MNEQEKAIIRVLPPAKGIVDRAGSKECHDEFLKEYGSTIFASTERHFLRKTNPLLTGKHLLNLHVIDHVYSLAFVNSNPQFYFFCYLYVCGRKYGHLQKPWPAIDRIISWHKKTLFAGKLPPDADTAFERFLLQFGYPSAYVSAMKRNQTTTKIGQQYARQFDRKIGIGKQRWYLKSDALTDILWDHTNDKLDIRKTVHAVDALISSKQFPGKKQRSILDESGTVPFLQGLQTEYQSLIPKLTFDYCGPLVLITRMCECMDKEAARTKDLVYKNVWFELSDEGVDLNREIGVRIFRLTMEVMCELSSAEQARKMIGITKPTPQTDVVFKIIGEFLDKL